MKKMDEMDRDIQLRAEELGYKTVLIALCAWTLFNVYQSYAGHTKMKMLPCLILCAAVCVQTFSQMAMKRKMIAGDEEYQEPDALVHTVILTVVIAAAVLSLGAWLFLKG